MKTLLFIWSLVIGHCLAGPFFFGQQGVVSAQSSAPPYSYPSSVIAAYTSTGSGSFSDGAAIDTLTAIAGNVQVFDYDADTDPGFPDAKFAELGLAIYTPNNFGN